MRLRLQGAVIIQSLTRAEVQQLLGHIGAPLQGLSAALQIDPELWRFAINPLSLSILTLAYRNKTADEAGAQLTQEER